MALITIVANPFTNTSAWCHNSKVRTGGWLIPWYRRSHSALLSFNHLQSNRRQSVTESRVELKNAVTQPSARYHLSKVGSVSYSWGGVENSKLYCPGSELETPWN